MDTWLIRHQSGTTNTVHCTWLSMALSAKRDGVKQVPWLSLTEWHEVYKQVYSNDSTQQNRAHETLLAWKARMPKLPVGVDCTLSILQVCLRDREWTPKIDNGELSISYENDLCLMYSTTIMRVLNHISNIGHTKQKSMFEIAKHINIPKWIVDLRHDTAHAHTLPSIGVLRIATNILLTWLHEEYWAEESRALVEHYATATLAKESQETDEALVIRDLLELWIAIKLYLYGGYTLVSSIPDNQLRQTLYDLRAFALNVEFVYSKMDCIKEDPYQNITNLRNSKKYRLLAAQAIVLSEITRYFRRKSVSNKQDIFLDTLFNIEAFLTTKDSLTVFIKSGKTEPSDLLPKDMIAFWRDMICIIQETNMMEPFVSRLLEVVYNDQEDNHTRSIASSWVCSILYSFVKLDKAQEMLQSVQSDIEITEVEEAKVKREIDEAYPKYSSVLWWDVSCIVPNFLRNTNFLFKLMLNPNEFSLKLFPPVLELAAPNIDLSDFQNILHLAKRVALGSQGEESPDNQSHSNGNSEKYFTVDDLSRYDENEDMDVNNQLQTSGLINPLLFGDRRVRNDQWKLASDDPKWTFCPIGILPWQIDSVESLKPLEARLSKCHTSILESEIIPGFINANELTTRSQVNWENVLRKTKRQKRKFEKRFSGSIVNQAITMAKKHKYAN